MKFYLLLALFFSSELFAESFPDFKLPIYKTESEFKLSEALAGKRVLINFWASWCTSCIKEIEILEKLKEKYKDKVVFVAVNAGEKDRLIDNFIKKHKFSYTILYDKDRMFSKSVGVDALPITIVIDQNKNVIYRGIVPPDSL